MAWIRIVSLPLLFLGHSLALGGPDTCESNSSAACRDVTGLLQHKLQVDGAQLADKLQTMHQNPVVLGMACKAKKANMVVFLTSLRATGYKGSVMIGVDPVLDDDTKRFIELNKVITDSSPCVEQAQKAQGTGRHRYGHRLLVDLCFTRYKHYRRWIQEGNYSHAWMLGVWDVVFQADPFAQPTPALGLYAYSNYPPAYELSQLEQCFGPETKQAWVHQFASTGKTNMCGDTIVGAADRLVRLCDDMTRIHDRLKSKSGDGCLLHNEQPMLNALIMSYGDEYVTRHDLHEGLAMSMWGQMMKDGSRHHCSSPKWFRKGTKLADGKVINKAGEVVPIVHKWGDCQSTRLSIRSWMNARGFRPGNSKKQYEFVENGGPKEDDDPP